MKKYLLFLFAIWGLTLNAQEKDIVVKTAASEATIFIKGAQVTRHKNIDIPAGKSTLRFTELSPYIDAKSIQLSLEGEIMVLAVNYKTSYKDTVKNTQEYDKLFAEWEATEEKILLEQANKEVINEELAFLKENRSVKGANQNMSFALLKEVSDYYTNRVTALKTKEIEINKKIKTLTEAKQKLQRQMADNNGKKSEIMGEILVGVDSKTALNNVPVKVSYYVNNAGWYPSYDIKAKSITDPIALRYKANIQQNTKEDWKNIKLKVSSVNPNLGNTAPKLQTYYLDYYRRPKYDNNALANQVKGRIYEASSNEPLPGATVRIKGSTIGTSTDINGNYTLSLPANGGEIEVNYIGFVPQTRAITSGNMDFYLQEDAQQLDEVVVVAYGSQKRTSVTGSVAGLTKSQPVPIPVQQIENQTSIEFEIKTPYTILSDNKITVVEMENYSLPASYEYYCVPKIDKDAFLLAYITNWEQYNLLEGEANIFFENTYIGKTVLDVRYMSDTLNISLGRDKNVSVQREKVKDYTSKKMLGGKNEVTRAWSISVRNNKKQPLSFILFDQVPVSTMSEIEVSTENISKGNLNKETGEVKWDFTLNPSEKKELELIYKVKYPRNRTLTIE